MFTRAKKIIIQSLTQLTSLLPDVGFSLWLRDHPVVLYYFLPPPHVKVHLWICCHILAYIHNITISVLISTSMSIFITILTNIYRETAMSNTSKILTSKSIFTTILAALHIILYSPQLPSILLYNNHRTMSYQKWKLGMKSGTGKLTEVENEIKNCSGKLLEKAVRMP